MEELEAVAYTRYEWDCPGCGDVNVEEHDPSGESLVCSACDAEVRITEVR